MVAPRVHSATETQRDTETETETETQTASLFMQRLAGRRYYYNEDSGESTFTRPRESIGALQAEDDDHSSYCGAAAARDELATMTDGGVDTTEDSSACCRPPRPSPLTHFLKQTSARGAHALFLSHSLPSTELKSPCGADGGASGGSDSSALPEGWEVAVSRSTGQRYFVNALT